MVSELDLNSWTKTNCLATFERTYWFDFSSIFPQIDFPPKTWLLQCPWERGRRLIGCRRLSGRLHGTSESSSADPVRSPCRARAEQSTEILLPWPGLFKNLFMTRRGGGVILQTASQHAYFSAKFCKFPFKISDILQKTKNFDNHLRFAAIPAKFCENRGEKWRIWTKIQQNFAKSRKNREN